MKPFLLIISVFLLSACSHLQTTLNSTAQKPDAPYASLHHYVSQLARQLFMSSNRLQFNETIAVGSFLPVEDLAGKDIPPSATLGQQIQESLVTLSTQVGMNVIEFKTTNTLKLEPHLDIMLSRDIKKINKDITIDYFLTGTYTFSQAGLVVNARLIDVSNSNVIAAATDIIPAYVVQGLTGQVSSARAKLDPRLYHLN